MEIPDKYMKKLFIPIVLMFCAVTTAFADKLEDRLRDINAFRDYKLTEQEQQILDHLDSIRTVKSIESLEADLNICKGIRDRVYKIINEKDAPDTVSTANRLLEFMSFFGGKTFIIKGHSIQEIIDNISLDTTLYIELGQSDNIKLGFCCVQDTITNYLYTVIYFTKYYIEFFPTKARSYDSPSGAVVTWFMYLKGKTNARYLKRILYPGDKLPFYYTGEYISVKELQTDEDGFFSLEVSFSIGKHDIGRGAIFAKDSEDEPYSLIEFGPM